MSWWVPLVSIDWYINSVRYLGLTTSDSIKELIDNSIDAKASNIYLNIFEEDGKIQITLEDNWIGVNKELINQVLSFWGRWDSVGPNIIWKFWWGLSSAACTQTKRTELYSKQEWGDDYYFSYIDLAQLKNQSSNLLPQPIVKKPKYEIQCSWKSWTFIHFKDCDNLDFKIISKLVEKIENDISETYRYFLSKGLKIYINNKEISIIDPLYQIDWAKDIDIFWKSETIFEYKYIPDIKIIDKVTNKPAEIKISIFLMDFDKIKNIPWYRSLVKGIFWINNQGFYLVRNWRQIWSGLTLSIFTKHNHLNYFRWEITFPESLDWLFWVHTNKSRFTIKWEIKDIIKDLTKKPISEARTLSEKFEKETLSRDDNNIWIKRSEKIISKLNKSLWINNKLLFNINNEKLEEEKKKEVDKINENEKLSEKEKKEEVDKINEKYNIPYIFDFESRWQANTFYEVIFKWTTQSKIVINIDHPFYDKIYIESRKEWLEMYLELMIYMFVKAEHEIKWLNKEKEEFYINEKIQWSNILRKLLNWIDEVDYDN